ncbi:hypothetical protein FRC11_001128, partial [Ceratobasidium sp. 423]
QSGRLHDEQVFRFCQVSIGRNKGFLDYPQPIRSCLDACNLVWSPEEKLYAKKVQNIAEDARNQTSWNDLPLARTHLVYTPFSDNVRHAMSKGCLPHYRTKEMVSLLFEMEKYGPVHTHDPACNEAYLAYIDPSMSDANLHRLLLGAPLRPAALLEDASDHAEFALPTFVRWVRTNERFRHRLSKTWRGGPDGVRWIVGTFVHFAAMFSVYEKWPRDLPNDRLDAFHACNFDRLQAALISLGSWLIESLKDSISILKKTFIERAQGWQDAVVTAHLADPDASIGNSSVALNTHGVPRSRHTLKECYEHLQSQDPDLTLGEDDIDLTR